MLEINFYSNYLNSLAFSTFLFLYHIKSCLSNESFIYYFTDSGENIGVSNFIPGFINSFNYFSAYFNANGLGSFSASDNYFFKAFASFFLINFFNAEAFLDDDLSFSGVSKFVFNSS